MGIIIKPRMRPNECKVCGKHVVRNHICRPFEYYDKSAKQWLPKETNFTRSEKLLELYLLEKHNITVDFIHNIAGEFEIDPTEYYIWFDDNQHRLL